MPADPNSPRTPIPSKVDTASKVVDPRLYFPAQFDALMRDIYSRGQEPERWRVLDAIEVRLDATGQEVEFILVQQVTNVVCRARVMLSRGKVEHVRYVV